MALRRVGQNRHGNLNGQARHPGHVERSHLDGRSHAFHQAEVRQTHLGGVPEAHPAAPIASHLVLQRGSGGLPEPAPGQDRAVGGRVARPDVVRGVLGTRGEEGGVGGGGGEGEKGEAVGVGQRGQACSVCAHHGGVDLGAMGEGGGGGEVDTLATRA